MKQRVAARAVLRRARPEGDRKPDTRELEEKPVAVIKKADAARVPARYGVAATETKLNRNRQSKRDDRPTRNCWCCARSSSRWARCSSRN